ncbi:MAG TPA: ArsA-related P-loop ATPase [Acidimicrobiia bacterium]
MTQTRLVVVSGKGGVGKSAAAAALALVHQREGQKVLAVDMLGASGLGAHLTAGKPGSEPSEIRPGLSILRIDRAKALVEYLKVQSGVPAVGTFGPLARAFDALASTAPGIREVVTIGKVLWEVRRQVWDVVVVDGPPTGQVGGYLRAPKTISELVPSGRIRQQADWMQSILLDGKITSVMLVSIPEELPTTETEETIRWLEEAEVTAAPTVIANRVLPELKTSAAGRGPVQEAAALHRSLWADQQEWLARLRPARALPYLFGLLTPGEVAARLADSWMET